MYRIYIAYISHPHPNPDRFFYSLGYNSVVSLFLFFFSIFISFIFWGTLILSSISFCFILRFFDLNKIFFYHISMCIIYIFFLQIVGKVLFFVRVYLKSPLSFVVRSLLLLVYHRHDLRHLHFDCDCVPLPVTVSVRPSVRLSACPFVRLSANLSVRTLVFSECVFVRFRKVREYKEPEMPGVRMC